MNSELFDPTNRRHTETPYTEDENDCSDDGEWTTSRSNLVAFDIAVRSNPDLLSTRTPSSIRRKDVPCHRDRQFAMVGRNDKIMRNKYAWTVGAMKAGMDEQVNDDDFVNDLECFVHRSTQDRYNQKRERTHVENRQHENRAEVKKQREVDNLVHQFRQSSPNFASFEEMMEARNLDVNGTNIVGRHGRYGTESDFEDDVSH